MRTERYAKFSEAHSGLGDAKKSFNDAYNTLNGDSSSYRRYLNGNTDYGQNPSTQTIIDGTIKTVQDAEAKLSDLQGEQERYTALIMSYVGNAQDGYTAFGQMLMDQGVDVSNIANMSVEAIKQIETAWNAMSGYNDWRDSLFGEKYASEFNSIKSWLGSLSKVNAAITDTEVQLETIRSEAQAQLREAASVIIADTLNPAQFPNLTMEELFNLEELLNNLDWSDKTYDEIRAIASNAAIQMTDEIGDAIKTANEHVAQAKSFGMSEMLYQALMGDLDQFSGTVFEGMFDEPIRALLKEWEAQKGAAIDAIGEGGEELVQRLADEGILSGAVLDAITNGIEGLRSQGREGEVAEVVAGLLSLDSLGSTEAEAVAIVDGYFNSLGVTLDENIQA